MAASMSNPPRPFLSDRHGVLEAGSSNSASSSRAPINPTLCSMDGRITAAPHPAVAWSIFWSSSFASGCSGSALSTPSRVALAASRWPAASWAWPSLTLRSLGFLGFSPSAVWYSSMASANFLPAAWASASSTCTAGS